MMIAVSEVPFNADIGSGVGDYLFEIVDEATAEVLQQEIERVITFSEPRVELVSPMGNQAMDNYSQFVKGDQFGIVNPDFNPLDTGNMAFVHNAPVVVQSQPDQNAFSVTITYKIVGYEQVITFNQLLEPTR